MPIDLPPYTTLMLYPHVDRERMLRMISRASEMMDKIEKEAIRRGLRKCDVHHAYLETLEANLKELHEMGLRYRVIDVVKRYQGFAHKHEKPSSLENSMLFMGACVDEESLNEFIEAHRRGDHNKIGEMLGYPECDRKFFTEVWSRGSYDPIPEIAMNTSNSYEIEMYPELNIMLRYVGIRIIPYFPHSFRCEKSLELAKKLIGIALDTDSEALEFVLSQLSKPLYYSQVNAITEIRNRDMIIVVQGYTDKEYRFMFFPDKGFAERVRSYLRR